MPAPTRAQVVLLTSQSLAAGGTVRARLDTSAVDGAQITWRITNGGTGPTVQCTARILVSHATTLPSAAAEGTGDSDWKLVAGPTGGGVTASTSTRGRWVSGPETRFVEVEFTGNTGQAVTVEAIATTYVY
jgi:hypothetical protein